MPLINYSCSCGSNYKKYVKSAKEALLSIPCEKCGKKAKKSLGSTSYNHMTTIDNGLMARKLEVDLSHIESLDEQSTKDFSEE